MPFTRRGFLGLLASAGIFAAEARSLPQSKASPAKPAAKPVQRTTTLPSSDLLKGRLLIDSYLPILKVNEGEKLNFYHKPGDKVTVGYGTNVESNPSYLSDVTIYYRGKPLMPAGKKVFLATMAKKNQTDLAQYTITAEDAKKWQSGECAILFPNWQKFLRHLKIPLLFTDCHYVCRRYAWIFFITSVRPILKNLKNSRLLFNARILIQPLKNRLFMLIKRKKQLILNVSG